MINLQGKLKEKLSKHRNFILYALIGITGVTIDLVSFFILYNVFHIHEQLANILSTSMGITNNFILNAFFNFKKTDQILKRFGSFYLIGVLGIILTGVILFIFSEKLGVNPNIVKLTAIIPVTIVQFTLNRLVSFRD